jgi:hypothetical protein
MNNSDRLDNRYLGYWEKGDFYHATDDGFFSCLSVILYELLHREGLVTSINTTHSFSPYKNTPNLNTWPLMFASFEEHVLCKTNSEKIKEVCWTPGSVNLENYVQNIDLSLFLPWVEKYFTPSKFVEKRVNHLQKKYNIDYANTITIHYRGTDKFKEVTPIPIEKYIEPADKLLTENPHLKVLIQSDEKDKMNQMLSYFGDKCFYIEELPQSVDGRGLHVDSEINFNKFKYGVYYLASILTISKCKYVITHLGNGGFWTLLYRGNTLGYTQL